MPQLTDQQVIDALRENGHDAEAQALAAKIAEPPADAKPGSLDQSIRRVAGRT